MGDWLGDTLDAAEFMALNMEKARSAPRLVAQELHAYSLGLADEMGQVLKNIREKGSEGRGQAAPADGLRRLTPSPPSSNTGGKVPRVNPNTKGV